MKMLLVSALMAVMASSCGTTSTVPITGRKQNILYDIARRQAFVESHSCLVLAGEHLTCASVVLGEGKMIVDAHLSCHSLNIEIVGADERECPPLFLHLVNERLYHFEVILLRAVLLAIGDDCHQDVVALGGLSVELGDGRIVYSIMSPLGHKYIVVVKTVLGLSTASS